LFFRCPFGAVFGAAPKPRHSTWRKTDFLQNSKYRTQLANIGLYTFEFIKAMGNQIRLRLFLFCVDVTIKKQDSSEMSELEPLPESTGGDWS
jgi:hypothetical protein